MEEINKEEMINSVSTLVNEILTYMDKDSEVIEAYLLGVVKEADSIFDIISSYQERFTRDEVNPVDFYYSAMDRLTGCYMYLCPVVTVVAALISKQSLKYYQLKKLEVIDKGEKFVATSTDKESSYYVANMKMTFSVLEGFLNSCLQGIQTCRRRVASTKEEEGLAR